VNTANSVVAVDTSATAFSGGTDIGVALTLNKDESDNINLEPLDLKLHSGESITFTGQSIAAGTTTSLAANWKELF